MSYPSDLSQAIRKIGLATICVLGFPQLVIAQQPVGSTVRRQSGGWQPTTTPTYPQVQTAYFQAQGSLSDGLPVLPTAGPGMSSASGGMPAFPGSAGLQATVSPPVNRPQEIAPPQLPMANRGNQNFSPPSSFQSSSQGYDSAQGYSDRQGYDNQAPYNSQPSYDNRALNVQQPVSPPANRPVPARLASSELRAIQDESSQLRNASPQFGGGGLREQGQPASGQANDGRLAAEGFTSGLPFVTPAPRGRYATSPYQPAVFQSSDYRPLAVPVQFVSSAAAVPQAYVTPQPTLTATQAVVPPTTGVNAPPYLTAQQATLPQYRYPQTGMFQTAYQCTPAGPTFPSTGAVPGAFVPPTLPPNLTPNLYTPNNSGYTPLFSLGQENYNVQLGRGLVGQPTVYVAGQPLRNFMRYLSP